MKKKVFSIKNYVLSCPNDLACLDILKKSFEAGWVEAIAGKEQNELKKAGYNKLANEWFEEIEVNLLDEIDIDK